jgi:hypothetical protein
MAKLFPKPVAAETEVPVVVMRRVGPERFEVVEGFVRGVFTETKRLESMVSMVVATDTACRALRKKHEKEMATVNPLMKRAV